ncbi:MAG: hypothetical protein Q6358_07320 [Candidatus Brocadiales bacterium]|nr:hypothetical protein [Candidatus Brocadiales bacterium]
MTLNSLSDSFTKKIVAKLDKETKALEGVRLLRQEAEKRIKRIIAEVWGEGNIK